MAEVMDPPTKKSKRVVDPPIPKAGDEAAALTVTADAVTVVPEPPSEPLPPPPVFRKGDRVCFWEQGPEAIEDMPADVVRCMPDGVYIVNVLWPGQLIMETANASAIPKRGHITARD
jgi:hypothetical protein